MNRRPAVIACIVVAVVALVVAVYYFTNHPKRGVAALVVAVAFGIGAWVLSRRKDGT